MYRITYIVLARDSETSRAHSFETAQHVSQAKDLAKELAQGENDVEIVLADGYMRDFGYAPGEYEKRDIRECVFAGLPTMYGEVA